MSNIFGDNVKRIRKLRGMTQKELADALGYTDRSTIAKIESGSAAVTYPMMVKIGHVLKVNPTIFFVDSTEYQNVVEFLPYLAKADDGTLNNIRKLLDMPSKKICKSTREIG